MSACLLSSFWHGRKVNDFNRAALILYLLRIKKFHQPLHIFLSGQLLPSYKFLVSTTMYLSPNVYLSIEEDMYYVDIHIEGSGVIMEARLGFLPSTNRHKWTEFT